MHLQENLGRKFAQNARNMKIYSKYNALYNVCHVRQFSTEVVFFKYEFA